MSFVEAIATLNHTDESLRTLAQFADDESLKDVNLQELLYEVSK